MKKKMSTWKLAVLLPVIVGFFFIVACQDQVMSEISDIAQNSTMATDLPLEVKTKLEELKEEDPSKEWVVVEMNEEGKKKADELFNRTGPKNIVVMSITEKDGTRRAFSMYNFDEHAKMVADLSQNGEEVFTIVEESAKPAEGIDEFYNFITTNLKYPEQARKIGVQGKVFVQFIINADGTLKDFEVLKGIGAGCDKEAMRVLALSKPWIPGKQRGKAVSQKMVMPIFFQLDKKSVETGSIETVEDKFIMLETAIQNINGKTVVKGTIKDSNGVNLPGANIIESGTSNGTVSDRDGSFSLVTTNVTGKLNVSFVGYQNTVIPY